MAGQKRTPVKQAPVRSSASADRRAARAAVQYANEIHNRALRAQGQLTPWEQACAERALRRKGGR